MPMPADKVQRRLGKLETQRQAAELREAQAEARIKQLETRLGAKTKGSGDVADTTIDH